MIGRIVSHYRILEKLGEGGMGAVYKAEDTKLQRIVALKFLSPAMTSDPEAKQSFINEAQAASALDHPNICTIYEIDETPEGQIFISMAYYQGETLRKKIERGPTSLREALHLVRQIGAGLAKAHDKGIVHRDIKPANLMVTEDQVIKILDFGVAKFQYKTDVVSPGLIIGTPAYMSPEQASGKPVDHRSDIWSVGVILFELLTSSLPFEGQSDRTLMQAIINDTPLSLSRFLGSLSASIQTIINKTLAKNPDERYQSIKDFLHDLDQVEQNRVSTAKTAVIGVAPPAIPSIAVLPFTDLSAEKDQEYFCDGLAEEIINDLSRLKVLRIASRNSSFQFKGKNLDISEIGRSLNVQKVLEGSIRKWGNRIRIAVRLINVADGFLVWADKYERELADIFDIQDDISKSVVENLKIQLAGASEKEMLKRYTDNVEAYSSYLKGRFYWNKRTAESIKTSIDYFQAAIDIDSKYALAYAGLADAYIVLGLYGRSSPVEVMPKALQAAEQALRIDEFLAEAHISLGCAKAIYEWKWREAEDQFQLGIKLKPEYAEAHHWYAINFLTPLGRFDEAEQEIKRALDLDPSSLVIHATVGLVYYYSRKIDAAIDQLHHALDMNPDFPVTNLFLGQAYLQRSRFNEAIDYFQRALKFYGDSNNALANYGYAAARSGDKKVANKILAQLLDASKKMYVSAYDIASVYCGLGDKRKAIFWLEKAVQEHAFLLSYLNVDPIMDPLRDQKKFLMLAQEILGRR
ncbi:MAG: protein kinase [candidate division KSB1 bacterium]|nr:protein kinase [candidate division KSB1 bacterium]